MQLRSFTLAIVLILFFSSCTKKADDANTVPVDPSGTITSNLGFYPAAITLTNANYALTYLGGGVTPTGVAYTQVLLRLDNSLNFYCTYAPAGSTTVSIANVGAVSGLGAITAYPSSGYTTLTSVTVGNGYVIKITDYDPSSFRLDRTRYFRIYVESYQLSTSGGILGVTLRYQGPY